MAAKKQSAGLLLYKRVAGSLEVLLVHPGGPFWAAKDEGAWSIPKGEPAPGEDLLVCARRELREETGFAPEGPFLPLGQVKLKSGKTVFAWAAAHDGDPASIVSNKVEMEWPPGSGRRISFPEVDVGRYFPPELAKRKLNPAQVEFVDRLLKQLSAS